MIVSADTWQSIGIVEDMADGEKREVVLASGKVVLLIQSSGKLHAVCADCPHQNTPLIEGSLDGTVLSCPLHYWQWDIETGKEIGLAELPLEIFELRRGDHEWFVRV